MELMSLPRFIGTAAILSALAACGGSDTPPLTVAVQAAPLVALVKQYVVLSCETPRTTPAILRKELADAGIETAASSCPFRNDLTFSAACGTPIPGYFMVDVLKNRESDMRTLGYEPSSSFPMLIAGACPA